MIENTLARYVGSSRPGSIGRRVSGAVLLAWIAVLMAPAVSAAVPAAAQEALRQFQGSGAAPRILFSHATSRKDTGWVSDKRAAKILAMEISAAAQHDLVALVKTAMQMFGLKSDACDNSLDSRCD